MKNLGKKTTLLGNIVLLLNSEKIYGFERNVKSLYGVPEVEENNGMLITNILKVVIVPIIILIGIGVYPKITKHLNEKVLKNLTITGILAIIFEFIAYVMSPVPEIGTYIKKEINFSLVIIQKTLPILLIPFVLMTIIVAFSKKMDKTTKKKTLIGILIELIISVVVLVILANRY